MFLFKDDFQYRDSYFMAGTPWFPIIIIGVLTLSGVIIYKLLRKKH